MDNKLTNVSKTLYGYDLEIQKEKGLYVNSHYNREYSLYINSKDRDLVNFPNPFLFVVEFMTRDSKNINFPLLINELNYLYIKQIYIPVCFLTECIMENKFFILRIRELNMQYQFCSSQNFTSATDIILYNVGFMNNFLLLDSKVPVQFNEELRPSVTKLTFQLLDGNMNPINIITNITNPHNPDLWKIDFNSESDSELSPIIDKNNIFIDIKLGVNDKIGLNRFSSKQE